MHSLCFMFLHNTPALLLCRHIISDPTCWLKPKLRKCGKTTQTASDPTRHISHLGQLALVCTIWEKVCVSGSVSSARVCECGLCECDLWLCLCVNWRAVVLKDHPFVSIWPSGCKYLTSTSHTHTHAHIFSQVSSTHACVSAVCCDPL